MISSFSTSTTIDLGRGTTAEQFKEEISPILDRKGLIYYSNFREPQSVGKELTFKNKATKPTHLGYTCLKQMSRIFDSQTHVRISTM